MFKPVFFAFIFFGVFLAGCAQQAQIITPVPEETPVAGVSLTPSPTPVSEPCFCTTQYDPVCAEDGNTYSNDCFANCAGRQVIYRGECGSLQVTPQPQPSRCYSGADCFFAGSACTSRIKPAPSDGGKPCNECTCACISSVCVQKEKTSSQSPSPVLIITSTPPASPTPTTTSTPAPTVSPTSSPTPSPTASPTPAPETIEVPIEGMAFNPKEITISKGSTIKWTNFDLAPHNAVSTNAPVGDGFASPVLSKGQSYSYTFNTTGTYDYYCSIHPYMSAKIIVK